MCGLSGLLADRETAEREATVRRMTAMLHHRGPDAGGTYVGDGIALGHRRLSIIDLTESGAQPMTLESGVTVAYNGEIYNFRELRRELEIEGARFRGRSDTEVIARAYDAWGLHGLRRLEGIFAIALWDPSCRRLVLMRDRLGVKPLFHASHSGALFFASEIKAIRAVTEPVRAIDPQALSEYLWFGNAFEDRTLYANIRSLEPGHWMIVERGTSRLERWWGIEEWLGSRKLRGFEEAVEATRSAVDKAVTRQLVADVPVGIFLSGGIDSSSIAATAARHCGRRLSSFSVGFDFDGAVDELPRARSLANELGFDHHELRISGASLPDVIASLALVHDEPFADAANIPLYLLAQQLQGEIKVVLQGDGGDEIFGGYRRYSMLRHAGVWKWLPRVAVSAARQLGPRGERFARMASAMQSKDAAQRMALLLTVETLHDPPTHLLERGPRESLARDSDPILAYRHCATRFAGEEAVQQMLLTDLQLQLPSQFLTKVDRATMAWGLEARVPLLDESIASIAVGMDTHFKVRGSEKKRVLRQAMRGRVPDSILDGQKLGFGVPYGHWIVGPLQGMARARLLDPAFLDAFGFSRARVAAALNEHVAGRRDRGFTLWKLLQLSLWEVACFR